MPHIVQIRRKRARHLGLVGRRGCIMGLWLRHRVKNASETQSASCFQVAITLSGLSEMDVMPLRASHWAKSGWSLGPWPQMPMYCPGRGRP